MSERHVQLHIPRPPPAPNHPTRRTVDDNELQIALDRQDQYARYQRLLLAKRFAKTNALPRGQRAILSEADLGNQNFRNRDLLFADLTGTNLRGADFTGATLTRSWLAGADLTDAVGITVEMALSIEQSGLPPIISGDLYDAILAVRDRPYVCQENIPFRRRPTHNPKYTP